ncbi:MAG: hypothetical protein AAF299_03120 [Pseudomonadota bacterium]
MGSNRNVTDDKFEFTNALQFDQQQYVELNGATTGKWRPVLIASFALAGILMLFWSYTLMLGIMVLAVTCLSVFAPQFLPGSEAWQYRENPLNQQEVLYGVSDQGLSFKTEGAEAEIVWARKIHWEERGDLLRIWSVNFPLCWFYISELKQAGVYDQVMDKCRRYGKQLKSN